MSKFAGWVLVLYAIVATGVAAYEYAQISWLEKMVRALVVGSPQ